MGLGVRGSVVFTVNVQERQALGNLNTKSPKSAGMTGSQRHPIATGLSTGVCSRRVKIVLIQVEFIFCFPKPD